MRRFILLTILFLLSISTFAADVMLLPQPKAVQMYAQKFRADKVKVMTDVLTEDVIEFVLSMGAEISEKSSKTIQVRLVQNVDDNVLNQDEYYKLKVSADSIVVEAKTAHGVWNALQTLYQLVDNQKNIPACEITDWPAFPVRGFMHDTGRSFISVDEIKNEIALLSRFKINVFHWHLTENQAWRLQSLKYPELTDSANMTRHQGQFYTNEDVKELVAFSKKHHVLLIPEIDMPGHSEAFVRAFKCHMQSQEGKQILKNLLDEACQLMDVPYIHIGTDEVHFTDPGFVNEMVTFLRERGKKVISWNPGWNYKPGEIDMTQMWSYRGKPLQGVPAIDSRLHYINHFDLFGDLYSLYISNIGRAENSSSGIAGSIIAIWNDRKLKTEKDIILQNAFYPSMLTLAERAWIGGGSEYFDKNGVKINPNDSIFKHFVAFEKKLLHYKQTKFASEPFPYFKQTHVNWHISEPFANQGMVDAVFAPEKKQSLKSVKVHHAVGSGIYLRHVWGKTVSAFFADPHDSSTVYASTYVYSPGVQKAGLNVEFQNYSRSEADLAPQAGKWDYNHSRVWFNENEIFPPVWTSTHTVKSQETDLGNENLTARSPQIITLKKGWNKIFIKLPIQKFSRPEVRLVKWMFTVFITSEDGKNEIPGLIYSPDKKK